MAESSQQPQPTQADTGPPSAPGTSVRAANGQASVAVTSIDVHNGTFSIPNPSEAPNPSRQQSSSLQPVPQNVASSSTRPTQQPTVATMDNAEGSREAEKDRASTSTHTHARTPSSRHKAADKSNSELAHTASTVAEVDQPKGRKSKPAKKKRSGPSLVSKLLRTLVPCFGPPAKQHAIDFDVEKPPPPAPAVPPPSDVREKQPAEVLPESKPAQEEPFPPPTTVPQDQQPIRETTPIPPPLQPVDIPPPSDDPAVVVPPTPTKTLPPEETAGLTSGAVQPPGSTGSSKRDSLHEAHRDPDSENESDASTSFTDEEGVDTAPMEDPEDEEERLIANGGAGIPIGPDGVPRPLLPPLSAKHAGRKCLVLDLDETLVHSSFKSIQQADYVVPVEIEYHWHNVYVIKRPGVDNFLKKMGEIYEVVVFTASLSKYADPVLDKLDIHRVVSHRLFRESCYNHRGNYVKDLSQLGRPIADTIIIDNSPASYIFHPNNAVPVSSWFNDPHDTELTDLVPFLTDLAQVDDVRGVLDGGL